jgi:hypothetical protein
MTLAPERLYTLEEDVAMALYLETEPYDNWTRDRVLAKFCRLGKISRNGPSMSVLTAIAVPPSK